MVLLAALTACVPVLESPPGAYDSVDWEAPENEWPTFEPPEGLEGEGFDDGDVVPDFRFVDQNGDDVSLWQFYGKVVVLDISTMWCGPCQQLAQDVQATADDYGDDLIYVTLLPQDVEREVPDEADLAYWADSFGIVTEPVISDDTGYSYQIVPDETFPVLLLIDRSMEIVERITPLTDEGVRAALDEVI